MKAHAEEERLQRGDADSAGHNNSPRTPEAVSNDYDNIAPPECSATSRLRRGGMGKSKRITVKGVHYSIRRDTRATKNMLKKRLYSDTSTFV